MVSNEQRREAAKELRQFLSKSWDKRAWDHDGLQTVGRLVGTSVGENILVRLADLIDRPTCFDTDDKDSKFFTCGACGFSDSQIAVNPFTLSIRYVKPSYRYCPNCGAEVVELRCFPECTQLKKIAESDDIGGDSLQFHDAAVRDYLSFKNAMESKSQGISKAIESLVKEAEKEVVE